MKKYITAALLFCAALTAACSKETAGSADTGDTGALEMRVSATRAEADGEYDPLQRLAVRIYRASGELLRQYTAETLPSRLELLAGEYRVEVDAGEAVPRRSPNVSTKARRPLRWQPDRRPSPKWSANGRTSSPK